MQTDPHAPNRPCMGASHLWALVLGARISRKSLSHPRPSPGKELPATHSWEAPVLGFPDAAPLPGSHSRLLRSGVVLSLSSVLEAHPKHCELSEWGVSGRALCRAEHIISTEKELMIEEANSHGL